MWGILEGRYKPKTHITLRQLQYQFNTIKMIDDDGDMEKHLQGVEWLKRQIEEQGEQISDSSCVRTQGTPPLCTAMIQCPDQYLRSAGRLQLHVHHLQTVGRISEVSYH